MHMFRSLRARLFALMLGLFAMFAVPAAALAAEAQPASVYYQCSSLSECLEFAYWYAFLR